MLCGPVDHARAVFYAPWPRALSTCTPQGWEVPAHTTSPPGTYMLFLRHHFDCTFLCLLEAGLCSDALRCFHLVSKRIELCCLCTYFPDRKYNVLSYLGQPGQVYCGDVLSGENLYEALVQKFFTRYRLLVSPHCPFGPTIGLLCVLDVSKIRLSVATISTQKFCS